MLFLDKHLYYILTVEKKQQYNVHTETNISKY